MVLATDAATSCPLASKELFRAVAEVKRTALESNESNSRVTLLLLPPLLGMQELEIFQRVNMIFDCLINSEEYQQR
jgi:hypothetical protein